MFVVYNLNYKNLAAKHMNLNLTLYYYVKHGAIILPLVIF